MKRRDFIKLSGLGVAGVMSSNILNANSISITNRDIVNNNYDALIIGTGYGSAVSALRLAEAGKRVLMIEMGMDWESSSYSFSNMSWAKKQSTWLKTTTIAPFGNFRLFPKFTGLLDRMDFDHVKVYAGRGVGGGSLANGGMSVTPKKSYFSEIFPELNADEFYNKYFPKANETLGVNHIPDDLYNKSEYYKFSRVGEKEAKKAGFKTVKVPNVYDFDYMQKEELGKVTKSAFGGEVIYGNNHGKKDLTKTYIKKARETGNVKIIALHKAELITDNEDGTYTVKVNEINTLGEVISKKLFRTNKLILGAGSLGTTELLLKSKAKGTLKNINSEVGKYWANNGNCMSGRNFIKGGTGNVQSTIPAAGVDNWDDHEHCFFTEIAPLPMGMETYTGLYLTINKTPKLGSIEYNETLDKIDINWDRSHNQHMVTNARYFVDKMNEANGGTYAGLLFDKGIGVDICYHPLGGAVINKATDGYGRLKGLPGIYIMDASLIPGSIGVNPYVTITALSEYCIENIIKNDFITHDNSSNDEVLLAEGLSIYPMSFDKKLIVEYLHDITGEDVEISIINWLGLVVNKSIFTTSKGVNKHELNGLWYLFGGEYVLKINIGGRVIKRTIHK